jgi:CysZ protein
MLNFERLKKLSKEYNSKTLKGLEFFFDAHHFILKNKLSKFLLISGALFLLVFTISIKAIIAGIESSEPWLTNWIITNLKTYINFSIEDLRIGIKAAFWLLKTAIDSNKESIFTSLFMIIGTPYFSFISEKVHKILTKTSKPYTIEGWLKEMKRGLILSITNSIKQLGFTLLITLISLIPIIGIIAPLLTFIVLTYYNGILMTDYSLESEGYNLKESKMFYSQNKPIMFSFGLGFMFLLLIPVVGWFLAPTYALTASSLYFFRQKNSISCKK